MKRLKERWNKQYPEKIYVSKQIMLVNAITFQYEMNKELETETPVYIEERVNEKRV